MVCAILRKRGCPRKNKKEEGKSYVYYCLFPDQPWFCYHFLSCLAGNPNICNITYLASEYRSDDFLNMTSSTNTIETMTVGPRSHLHVLMMEHTVFK
jgi:hypothetical protein